MLLTADPDMSLAMTDDLIPDYLDRIELDGERGTIVLVHGDREAFMVEFSDETLRDILPADMARAKVIYRPSLDVEERVHPETGKTLRRDVRPMVVEHRGLYVTVDQPAWYPVDDSDSVLQGSDAKVVDDEFRKLRGMTRLIIADHQSGKIDLLSMSDSDIAALITDPAVRVVPDELAQYVKMVVIDDGAPHHRRAR